MPSIHAVNPIDPCAGAQRGIGATSAERKTYTDEQKVFIFRSPLPSIFCQPADLKGSSEMNAPSRLVPARPAHRTADRRQRRMSALVPLAALLLAACGGGGGGGGSSEPPVDSDVPLLVLTEANAKAAAYNAVLNVSNPAPQSTASFVVALTTDSDPRTTPKQASAVAMSLVRLARAGTGSDTKAAINESITCRDGGSFKAEGELAAPESSVLSSGDRLTLVASACKYSYENSVVSVTGKVSFVVQNYQAGSPPQLDIAFTFDNFQSTLRDAVITLNGDLRMKTLSTGTTQEYSGKRLSSAVQFNGQAMDLSWRDYRSTFTLDQQGDLQRALAARVETMDPRLGASHVAYDLTTLTPATGREIELLSVKLQGRNSALAVQLVADNKVNMQLDEDGDGKYEKDFTYDIKDVLP